MNPFRRWMERRGERFAFVEGYDESWPYGAGPTVDPSSPCYPPEWAVTQSYPPEWAVTQSYPPEWAVTQSYPPEWVTGSAGSFPEGSPGV